MKKIKFVLSLTLIFALALPLFIMPINAANEEPEIEELVELAKEAQYFVAIFGVYYNVLAYRIPQGYQEPLDEVFTQKAIEWGYYNPDFDAGELIWPFSAVDLVTGEVHNDIQMGTGLRFPDTVTVEKVREDVRKYFVSDFLKIIDNAKFGEMYVDTLCYLSPDGHVYNHFFGQFGVINYVYGIPIFETAKIKQRNENKITLEFDGEYDPERQGKITIQYTKTDRGWRISGATGYYKGEDIFAPEIPETADNSVIYIALASVSIIALAGVTLVSTKKKKEHIA